MKLGLRTRVSTGAAAGGSRRSIVDWGCSNWKLKGTGRFRSMGNEAGRRRFSTLYAKPYLVLAGVWRDVIQGRSFSGNTDFRNAQSREEGDKVFSARVPLKAWQQAAVAFGSAVGALVNPARADLVAALGETTGRPAFHKILERMKKSPEGQKILSERPRVLSSSVGHAWDLPVNTFGAAYAKFMGSRNFSPDDRPPVRFMDTEELSYVATRVREVHDFWHVLFKLPTNVLGEAALKIVEFQQTYLPMCFLSVMGGSLRLRAEQRNLLLRHYFPWALRAGSSCADLMCIYYEKCLHEDVEGLRQKWGIIPAPPLPSNKSAY